MALIKADFQKKQSAVNTTTKEKVKIPGYRLRVDLGFSSPVISRTVKVNGSMTLGDFHSVIQACFGWQDEATHRFLVGKIFYSPAEVAKNENTFNEEKVELHELEEGMGFIFTYLYESGSGWECEITLEEKYTDGSDILSPQLLDAERAFPGEQFDDIHEYQELLSVIDDTDNRTRTLATHELPADFDPDRCEMEDINSKLQSLS